MEQVQVRNIKDGHGMMKSVFFLFAPKRRNVFFCQDGHGVMNVVSFLSTEFF